MMFGNRRARRSLATRSPCMGSGASASSDAIADRYNARRCDGATGSVTANGSGRATLVAMVQASVLPPQDGQLVSQGDEFELQGEVTTNPEQEQGAEGGQKREHAGDGMAVARETLCFLCFLEF